jgi:pimeloyl-ACP methyl ester carboxylesterase
MTEWLDGKIEANGIQIHYHRTGGGKPPLLLLHGITDHGLCWKRAARDLEDCCDSIMPDARGHGLSDGLAGGFSIPILAEDAAGLIQALRLENVIVWGHSMGAITAAYLAAGYPDLVKGIILEDPPLGFNLESLPPEFREAIKQENQALRAMPPEQQHAWAAAQNPGWHPDELGPWLEAKVRYDPGLYDQFGVFASNPWQAVFTRLHCPGLLLTGDLQQGAIVSPETARQAVELWAQGKVVHFAGAGHSIHRERYEQVVQVVREFIDRLAA